MTSAKASSPYFSIIIPCLNEEQYLPHLLKNLNQQTYKNIEVIVVDGNSTDKTPELVNKFSSSYPLTLLTTKKRNVAYQRNLGAKRAAGDVLIFFDADTQIPKDYLSKIRAAFISKHPDILTTWMTPDTKKASHQFIATTQNIIFEFGRAVDDPSVFGAMLAFKKNVFNSLQGFDQKTKFGEDAQIVKYAIRQGYNFIILPQPKYIFSMRRFKKEGSLEQIIKYIKLGLTIKFDGYHSQKTNYPMGGQLYASQKLKRMAP